MCRIQSLVRPALLLIIALLSGSLGLTLPCRADPPDPVRANSAVPLDLELQPLLDPPADDDYTDQSLFAYQERLASAYGGYHEMPLDVKAAYFDWEMWRYHRTPYHQVYNRVHFPDQIGQRPVAFPARDSSTWHGMLLGTLCFKYATLHDAATLEQIAEVLQGLHLFFEVTQQPGLMARAVSREDGMVLDELKPNRYVAPNGTVYYFQGDPAKGGYNQIAGGYAALMMHVYPDLPPELQRLAREDMTNMILHVIDHGYQATNRDGSHTTYGDMRPLLGSMSIPFHAQVAYEIVALGYSFPPDDPAQRARIVDEFRRLRGKHHVYYEFPLRSVVLPQRVGASPFVKGMNDRAHVTLAAFYGLALELDYARRNSEPFNEKFVYQLGRTMYWSMDYLADKRNALCAFMWAGLLRDPRVRGVILERSETHVDAQVAAALRDGVEQLRHFKLDRFQHPGPEEVMGELQWMDDYKPTDNYFHVNPYLRLQVTGPRDNVAYCGMDFLHAYWIFRYYRLDEHIALREPYIDVLRRTPGLRPSRRESSDPPDRDP